jgi:dipicolinate synthase subunit A
MKFSIIGGDRRQIEIAAYLKSYNHEVTLFGLPDPYGLNVADSLCEAISNADAIILPVPVSKDGRTVTTPLTNDVIFLQDIITCRPKFLFGGMIKQGLSQELKAADISYCDYFNSEALTVKNAVLTAEAAVSLAVNGTDRSIFGSNVLVIGYGRIGKQLAKYLKVLGADVTATSRNSGTRAEITIGGFNSADTYDCRNIAQNFDYIFNTVPSNIMDSSFFGNCKKTAFVEDLATDSGTDLAAATKYGINAAVYSGLPGKHSPVTAAKFIADEILLSLG